jgi:hypothetical protein
VGKILRRELVRQHKETPAAESPSKEEVPA